MKFSKVIMVLCFGLLARPCLSAEIYGKPNLRPVDNIDKTRDIGVGAYLGSLSGINAKYWANEYQAGQMGLSFAGGNTAINVDYIYNYRTAFERRDDLYTTPYLGIGLISAFGSNQSFFTKTNDNLAMALRVPLGLELLPRHQRFGVFGEIIPSLGFVPSGYTFLSADIGARLYF